MGDTAAPQAAAGLLGCGGGGGGAATAPRVHSAIVERLRARIAVCRQHHLTCEGRYERGRAESSERERESTLQLLNLVQHGQAARKGGKHAKAAAAAAAAGGNNSGGGASNSAAPPSADYYQHQLLSNGTAGGGRNGINGEQQQQQQQSSAAGEQRNPALVAVSIPSSHFSTIVQCKEKKRTACLSVSISCGFLRTSRFYSCIPLRGCMELSGLMEVVVDFLSRAGGWAR